MRLILSEAYRTYLIHEIIRKQKEDTQNRICPVFKEKLKELHQKLVSDDKGNSVFKLIRQTFSDADIFMMKQTLSIPD